MDKYGLLKHVFQLSYFIGLVGKVSTFDDSCILASGRAIPRCRRNTEGLLS